MLGLRQLPASLRGWDRSHRCKSAKTIGMLTWRRGEIHSLNMHYTFFHCNIIQHHSTCFDVFSAWIQHTKPCSAEAVALHRIVLRRTPGDVQLQSHLSSRSVFLLRQGRKAGREVPRCQICIDLHVF